VDVSGLQVASQLRLAGGAAGGAAAIVAIVAICGADAAQV